MEVIKDNRYELKYVTPCERCLKFPKIQYRSFFDLGQFLHLEKLILHCDCLDKNWGCNIGAVTSKEIGIGKLKEMWMREKLYHEKNND